MLVIEGPVDPAYPMQAGTYLAIEGHPDLEDFIGQRMVELSMALWSAADRSGKFNYEHGNDPVWIWLPATTKREWAGSADRAWCVLNAGQGFTVAERIFRATTDADDLVRFEESLAHASPEAIDAMLVAAVAENDATKVARLVRLGANCNAVLPDGRRLLHLCAEREMQRVAGLLQAGGADVLIADSEGHYPAESAIDSGYYDLAQQLGLQESLAGAAFQLDELEWNYASLFAYKWRYLPQDGKLTADSEIYLNQFDQALQTLESLYVEISGSRTGKTSHESALNSKFRDALCARIRNGHEFCCNEILSIYELDRSQIHSTYKNLPAHLKFARFYWPEAGARYETMGDDSGSE